MMQRRQPLQAGAASFATPWFAASAQSNTLRMVVPFGAGTTTDIVSRVVAEGMARALQQSVISDNKPGAGGASGSDQVAKAAGDGRTTLMGTVGTHAINAALYKKLPYDTIRDFAPIALVGFTPTLLVVAADHPAKSLRELVALAGRGEGITFASAGNGTSGHLAGEMLVQQLGGRMLHVPYKEGAMAMTAVMSRQVDFMFYHPAAVNPQIKAGQIARTRRQQRSEKPHCARRCAVGGARCTGFRPCRVVHALRPGFDDAGCSRSTAQCREYSSRFSRGREQAAGTRRGAARHRSWPACKSQSSRAGKVGRPREACGGPGRLTGQSRNLPRPANSALKPTKLSLLWSSRRGTLPNPSCFFAELARLLQGFKCHSENPLGYRRCEPCLR
jgi:hypothetical protein